MMGNIHKNEIANIETEIAPEQRQEEGNRVFENLEDIIKQRVFGKQSFFEIRIILWLEQLFKLTAGNIDQTLFDVCTVKETQRELGPITLKGFKDKYLFQIL